MASGDVVFQATNLNVQRDDSESQAGGTLHQETALGPGTVLVPSAGASLNPLVISVNRTGSSLPETLFDSTKKYKMTIEEV